MTCSRRKSGLSIATLVLTDTLIAFCLLVTLPETVMAQANSLWKNYSSAKQSSATNTAAKSSQSLTKTTSSDIYGELGSSNSASKPQSRSTRPTSENSVRPIGYQANVNPTENRIQDSATVAQVPKGEMFSSGQVLAMVAGEPIFAGDLLLTINEIIQIKAADAPEHAKEKMREQGIRELLPRAIERKMFYHQALQMLPDPSRVDDIKKDLYKQLEEKQLPEMLKKYEANNTAELDGRLRMLGSSWRAVKEQAAEQEIAKFGITSKIKIKTEISHDELVAEYNRRLEEFHLENQVKWEHLLVSFANYPDRKAAKRRLALMGNEIINGAKFSAVAEKGSDGFFASKGGMNNWTKRGSLTNTQLEDAIFELPVNRLSDIIETSQGFHIVRVIERQEEGYIPFAETQDKLRESILDARQTAATQELMKDIKNEIPYEVFVEGIEF